MVTHRDGSGSTGNLACVFAGPVHRCVSFAAARLPCRKPTSATAFSLIPLLDTIPVPSTPTKKGAKEKEPPLSLSAAAAAAGGDDDEEEEEEEISASAKKRAPRPNRIYNFEAPTKESKARWIHALRGRRADGRSRADSGEYTVWHDIAAAATGAAVRKRAGEAGAAGAASAGGMSAVKSLRNLSASLGLSSGGAGTGDRPTSSRLPPVLAVMESARASLAPIRRASMMFRAPDDGSGDVAPVPLSALPSASGTAGGASATSAPASTSSSVSGDSGLASTASAPGAIQRTLSGTAGSSFALAAQNRGSIVSSAPPPHETAAARGDGVVLVTSPATGSSPSGAGTGGFTPGGTAAVTASASSPFAPSPARRASLVVAQGAASTKKVGVSPTQFGAAGFGAGSPTATPPSVSPTAPAAGGAAVGFTTTA